MKPTTLLRATKPCDGMGRAAALFKARLIAVKTTPSSAIVRFDFCPLFVALTRIMKGMGSVI